MIRIRYALIAKSLRLFNKDKTPQTFNSARLNRLQSLRLLLLVFLVTSSGQASGETAYAHICAHIHGLVVLSSIVDAHKLSSHTHVPFYQLFLPPLLPPPTRFHLPFTHSHAHTCT